MKVFFHARVSMHATPHKPSYVGRSALDFWILLCYHTWGNSFHIMRAQSMHAIWERAPSSLPHRHSYY